MKEYEQVFIRKSSGVTENAILWTPLLTPKAQTVRYLTKQAGNPIVREVRRPTVPKQFVTCKVVVEMNQSSTTKSISG